MTHAIRRRAVLLGVLAVAAIGAMLPSPAAAQDTSAIAVNTRDGASIFRLAFNIRRVTGDVVDQTNAAVAYASCEECRTVAISIQVLLVAGDPSIVSPTNLALAINEDCTLCDTFAAAYQIVLGDGTRLRFTPEGIHAIADIRRELKGLKKQNLSDDELAGQVAGLVDRLRDVLHTELVGVGEPGEPPPPRPESVPTETQPPAATTPAQTTPAQTTPVQTTPVQTAPAPAQTTPTETVPQQTTTAPAPTQTTP